MLRRRYAYAFGLAAGCAGCLGLGAMTTAGLDADRAALGTVRLASLRDAPSAPELPQGVLRPRRMPVGLGNAAGPLALGGLGLGLMAVRRR